MERPRRLAERPRDRSGLRPPLAGGRRGRRTDRVADPSSAPEPSNRTLDERGAGRGRRSLSSVRRVQKRPRPGNRKRLLLFGKKERSVLKAIEPPENLRHSQVV